MLMKSRQHEYEEIATAVQGAMTRSLEAVGDPVGQYLPTRIEADPNPVRVTVKWKGTEPEHRSVLGPAIATTRLRSARVRTAARCHELIARLSIPVSSWRDGPSRRRLLGEAATFAANFRETEKRAILRLLRRNRPLGPIPSLTTVGQAVGRLNGLTSSIRAAQDHLLCRLLSTGPLVADAIAWGVVEDAVDVKGALPVDVGAMVVPTFGGPVVERLVDDLSMHATPAGDAISFTLVQQFFLANAERVELLAPFAVPSCG